jgi:hypothetical protein
MGWFMACMVGKKIDWETNGRDHLEVLGIDE